MMWPQYTIIGLWIFNAGVVLARFGQPKRPDTYDFVDLLFRPALMGGLLYAGGFFDGILR